MARSAAQKNTPATKPYGKVFVTIQAGKAPASAPAEVEADLGLLSERWGFVLPTLPRVELPGPIASEKEKQ
jgi:hypothetical protein